MNPADEDWGTVYNGLIDRIDQRKIPPGTRLPTQQELAADYDVTRTAVRTALSRLQAYGYVTAPGRGSAGRRVREYAPIQWDLSTFEVRHDRQDDADRGIDEWTAGVLAQGRTPHQTVDVSPLPARADIANAIGAARDELVFRRRRVRMADNIPICIADTWVQDDIAKLPYTQGDQRIYPWLAPEDTVLPGGIVAAVGINQVWCRDRVYVRHATPEEADLLQIDPTGEPVGEHVRIGYDENDRPFRVLISVFPGSAMYLQYDLKYHTQMKEVP